jgi:hypothetical protein
MPVKRVQFNNIVQNQLPEYVRDEFPLVSDFLKTYYQANEYQGAPADLIQNIDQYSKLDETTNTVQSVTLNDAIDEIEETINVDMTVSPQGTKGFPENYGLLKIDNEIITYTGKTDVAFTGCVRGFCGISSYKSETNPDVLVFDSTASETHTKGSEVTNLSTLFLKEFLLKTKYQLLPGLEDRSLHSDLNQNIFIKQAKDFYLSKGTDRSFEILFKALYDEEVKIIRPGEFLFTPSNAQYRVTNDLVVEAIEGDPVDLEQSTLFQNEYGADIQKAYAPITSVEKVFTGTATTAYKFSIDGGYNRDSRVDGAMYGAFSVHPKTKLIGQIGAGTTVLNVDSTVDFAHSGELSVIYNDTTTGIVSYTSKSLTQFFGCSNITGIIEDAANIGINTYAFGTSVKDSTKTIKVRINNVLDKLEYSDKTKGYSKGNTAKIKTLGVNENTFKGKNWVYNLSPIYNITKIQLIDSVELIYQVTTDADTIFKIGDNATIKGTDGINKETTVISLSAANIFNIKGQGNLAIAQKHTIQRNLSKGQSNTFTDIDLYSTNVQNTYKKGSDLLIATPSLPTYNEQPLNVSTRSITFSGTFDTDTFKISDEEHGFYTGDAVYYIPEIVSYNYYDAFFNSKTGLKVNSSLFTGDLEYVVTGNADGVDVSDRTPPGEGLYFVKRVDSTTIKLASSQANIAKSDFIFLENTAVVTNCIFTPYNLRKSTLQPQEILREVSLPKDDGVVYSTEPGSTGILINGVEITNYKSTDFINYGKLNSVDVVSNGSGYDIINPPLLNISDSVGTGATGFPAISGSLNRIEVIDTGFDYTETPIITITGGAGEGAFATANMKSIVHKVSFNSSLPFAGAASTSAVNLATNTIGFGAVYHKFRNAEEVIYNSDGQTVVGGLIDGTNYFVNVVDEYNIKIHSTYADAIIGSNPIDLTSYGIGKQILRSVNKKSVIDSINVVNPGTNYQNKKRTVQPVGISTVLDKITINNHDYSSGQVVKYTTEGTNIQGLTNGSEYYVTKIDDNNFKLSETKDLYDTEQYVNIKSIGVGTQVFNYQDISVTLTGNIGISSVGTETFTAKIQPIFRGEVTSIHLSNNGDGYGSAEIINFDREPSVFLIGGRNAQLQPVVVDGKIIDVIILNKGKQYSAVPDLDIDGVGFGAILTPVIENNQLTDVKIISGGTGYVQASTTVSVRTVGSGLKVKSNIQTWNINLFQRDPNFTEDDGFIVKGNKGLQYTHLYAPRKLREVIYSVDQSGRTLYNRTDLRRVNNTEIQSEFHSPIIGWAYDGNPIYGPYGYLTDEGGTIAQMQSGYSLDLKEGRPSVSIYPEGFFVEDYSHKEVNDNTVLDKNNGRFCVTPEFPNGTYAYFATIDTSVAASAGPFDGYKEPKFPYLIGANYNSIPNNYNFSHTSTQHNFNPDGWFRNTQPYNLIDKELNYKYLSIPNDLLQTVDITGITPGTIDKIGIQTGGELYKVGDRVVFDNNNTSGTGADAKVSNLEGKRVTNVSVASSVITGVEIYPTTTNGEYEIVSPNPHNFVNTELLTISGLSTTSSKIGGTYNVGVTTNTWSLLGIGTSTIAVDNVSTTGIVTFLKVVGDLSESKIRSNDILGIGTEKVKVLNVEPLYSRIRVLREVDNTVGSSHSVTTVVYEQPRRLTVNAGFNTTYDYKVNKEIYFNPIHTVGVGTLTGIGVGNTISLNNPGAGSSEIFIPTKSLYIPNHGLKTGDKLNYFANTGLGISITYDSNVSIATLPSTVYVAKISDDLVGLATVRVALGSTGTFKGIDSGFTNSTTLFFTGIGTGTYHSFKTTHEPITGEISQHIVTVAAASTHGLSNNDVVNVSVNPNNSKTFVVKYNKYNRRLVVDPTTVTAANINTTNNSFSLVAHGYVTGEKVIHTASVSTGGLDDNGIYYIVKVDNNTFKLSTTYYKSTQLKPVVVDITSAQDATFSKINPLLKVYKDSTVTFDLSDSSLSYINQGVSYSAFAFNFYVDKDFNEDWKTSKISRNFEVQRTGIVGVTADAKVTLKVDNYLPEILFYKLDPISENDLPDLYKNIIIDPVINNSEIEVKNSLYNGEQTITIGSTSSFKYSIPNIPESSSYNTPSSDLKYTTTSKTAFGSINQFEIINKGQNYYSLPGISNINSISGKNALVEASSDNIGQIKQTKIKDIGFDYPSDPTLTPSVNLPQFVVIRDLGSLESVGVTSVGKGYGVAPKLVVLDGETKKELPGVDLKYTLGNSKIEILKNTTGMSMLPPTILPIENSNGVGINTISYNPTTKDVTVELNVGFSTADTFPFNVNDKVMVENISVGVGSTGLGYNSVNYNHQLFTITATHPNIGGIGATVTYNMGNLVGAGKTIGEFIPGNSAGRIIPEKYFPVFETKLTTNEFFVGEEVKSKSATGIVESWDTNDGVLKISSKDDFVVNEVIKGSSSNTQGIASSITSYDAHFKLKAFARVEKGNATQSGVLNYNMQRIQDSFYYQNFAYSLRSRVDYDTWDDLVSSVNHTLGFRKFSDYQLENEPVNATVGLSTNLTSFEVINDLIGYGDLNCDYDFDLVRENSLLLDYKIASDEIIFNSRVLTDYYESIGNRVLSIDDISPQFNSHPRATAYSVAGSFSLSDTRSLKYLTFVRDKRFIGQRQLMVVDLIHDNANGYINQYGRVETQYDQGSFDFVISGNNGQLLFYPTKSAVNDYWVMALSYNLNDNFVATGATSFGGVVTLDSQSTELASTDTSKTIVSVATTYRSIKSLVNITADTGAQNNEYELTELNIIHDGTDAILSDYGQLTTTLTPWASSGFGTYRAYIDGSNVKVDFYPNAGIGTTAVVNTVNVAMAAAATGIGTADLKHARIEARTTAIASNANPTPTVIADFPSQVGTNDQAYDGGYLILQVTDTTNNRYQMSEFIVVDDYVEEQAAGDTYDTEYGNVETVAGLGTFGSRLNINPGATTNIEIVFTPLPNIAVEVNAYTNALRIQDDAKTTMSLDAAGSVTAFMSDYTGTDRDIKRAFNLTHNNYDIFERSFEGNDSNIVSVDANTIRIPNHFFVSGEKIKYAHAGIGSTQAIEIVDTNFPELGFSTTFVPKELFAVKIDADKIKLASSAENALKVVPEVLDITSVGIGTSHRFTSTNQNPKVIVALDNILQSPIVATAQTTVLADEIFTTNDLIPFSGITSFFGSDLVRIEDEIMKIEGVGIGSTNMVRVRRGWLGTPLAGYGTGTLITKVNGNYNIVDNTLNFAEPPYGNIPQSSPLNPPDSRDWVGISTSSNFQGRTFLRRGVPNTTNETYYKNYIFDDISAEFNGINKDFTLKSEGQNVTGIATENGVILVNDVFQGPGAASNYTLAEASGITTITFTGEALEVPTLDRDANATNRPLGGTIVSVGSTEGWGYQPLVAAGGTAIVSTAGTITSISIGNTGSGYRSGIQTVNVSIQQESLTSIDKVEIGTATVSDGHVTGVAVTNSQVFYKPRNITNVGYSSITGISEIKTFLPHGLSLGDEVTLSGIAFTCTYSGPKSITGFAYSASTGIATVTTSGNHGYVTGKDVIFTGIAMTCGLDNGDSTHYYPRGEDYAYNNSVEIASTTPTTITLDVGVSNTSEQFSHTFVSAEANSVVTGGDYDHIFVNALSDTIITGGDYEHTFVSAIAGGVNVVGVGTTTPTNATYNAKTGEMVLVIPGHSYIVNNNVGFSTNAISFSCGMDHNTTVHSYPRITDPIAGITTAIIATTPDTITINVGTSPLVNYDVSDASYNPVNGDLVLNIGNHTLRGETSHNISTAAYNPSSGIMTCTVAGVTTFADGDRVMFVDNSLSFVCEQDNFATTHTYPRATDPKSKKWLPITGVTTNTFEVQVLDTIPSTNTGIHTFLQGSLKKAGESIRLRNNSINFRCAMDDYTTIHSYPRSTDPASNTAVSIGAVTNDTITVKVGTSLTVYHTPTNATYDAGNGTLVLTIGSHQLTAGTSVKLLEESLSFTCAKDSGITTHKYPRKPDPYYAGTKITEVNSANEFVVNVGVSTVPTYYKSGGTVQGVIVAPRPTDKAVSNGTDTGRATVLSIVDNNTFRVNTGVSSRTHFYARSGKVSKALDVVFDTPLSYDDMPLVYANGESGFGTAAKVNVQVGQGSSVIDFKIVNTGYGYGVGDILTVPIGGTTGIPTTSGFQEFQLTVTEEFTDEFTGWSIGTLDVLDDFDGKFDGSTKAFRISKAGTLVSIRSSAGSNINVEDALLVFVNDILQVPGRGYTFSGGSVITFTEAPKSGDKSKILFYKGTGGLDVVFKDILETIKKGDKLTVGYDPSKGQKSSLQEDPRIVTSVDATDLVTTNPYFGPGNTTDETLMRPVVWCRQTEDEIVDGKEIGKDRSLYEPSIYPSGYLIKTVGVGSTAIWVDNLRPFFNAENENDTETSFQNGITLYNQDKVVGASATAVVSAAGTISSIILSSGGIGYPSAPIVSIASTIGFNTSTMAMAEATISNGTITGIAITNNGGVGYDITNPPQVLIDPPVVITEKDKVSSYAGDNGIIVGFGTDDESGMDKFVFDFYIPDDSYLRDPLIVGTALTLSSIQVNDFFVITQSNVGLAETSLVSRDINQNIIGVGTQFVDNVYQASDVSFVEVSFVGAEESKTGIGTTHITRVKANLSGVSTAGFSNTNIYFDSTQYTFDSGYTGGSGVSGMNTIGGGTTSSVPFGNFSWGRIELDGRTKSISYPAYTLGGIGIGGTTNPTGIHTSSIVVRTEKLKSKNYAI